MKPTVYLAGPILGQTRAGANSWREYAADLLDQHGVLGISPLRCEPLLVGLHYEVTHPEDPKFGSSRAIASKNYYDVDKCDMVLAYMPHDDHLRHVSYGTLIEMGWAYAMAKCVILVTDDRELSSHPVVNACASFLLPNLEDAIDVAVGILAGYAGGKNV